MPFVFLRWFMNKILPAVLFFFFSASVVFAQGIAGPAAQSDASVKGLAGNIHRKLVEKKASKIAFGQFAFQNAVPLFSAYLVNQLSGELANMAGRSYVVLSDGTEGADWTLAGEIVEIADIVRVYTRLVRSADRAVEASFQLDFERNEYIIGMLSTGSGRSSGRSSSSASPVLRDAFEPDSWDNPVTYEIGTAENAAAMSRTIHSNNDEDFFLLLPDRDGRLTVETTGNTDTMMVLYNADTMEDLTRDDDSGSDLNARIRYSVQAGKRYVARVTGFDDDTGAYSFRAYLPVRSAPDEYEPDDDSSAARTIEIGVPQQHNFHSGNDIDWLRFQITRSGRYTIRARGVDTNRLDTYIELFDSNLNSIYEDDDGGDGYSSRISIRLDNGFYYMKIFCLDDEPSQPYTVSIEGE
jgi:hypothetical protein